MTSVRKMTKNNAILYKKQLNDKNIGEIQKKYEIILKK